MEKINPWTLLGESRRHAWLLPDTESNLHSWLSYKKDYCLYPHNCDNKTVAESMKAFHHPLTGGACFCSLMTNDSATALQRTVKMLSALDAVPMVLWTTVKSVLTFRWQMSGRCIPQFIAPVENFSLSCLHFHSPNDVFDTIDFQKRGSTDLASDRDRWIIALHPGTDLSYLVFVVRIWVKSIPPILVLLENKHENASTEHMKVHGVSPHRWKLSLPSDYGESFWNKKYNTCVSLNSVWGHSTFCLSRTKTNRGRESIYYSYVITAQISCGFSLFCCDHFDAPVHE